jgi:hypothetical protein
VQWCTTEEKLEMLMHALTVRRSDPSDSDKSPSNISRDGI